MPVVDRREFGGRFSVSENSKRLSNYRYLEIQLMEMLGGWCHTTPQLAFKATFGYHVYDHARNAELLAERLDQLRSGRDRADPPNSEFAHLCEHVWELESIVDRLVAVYRVLEPHLVSTFVYHADATDPLADTPTVRLLHQLAGTDQSHIAWGQAVLDSLTQDPGERKRALEVQADLEQRLVACGGVTGRGIESHRLAFASAGEQAKPKRTNPGKDVYRFSKRCAPLDHPVVEEQFWFSGDPAEHRSRYGEDQEPTLEGFRARFHQLLYGEVETTDRMGKMLAEFPELPWEMRLELAHQMWDQARHIEIVAKVVEEELGGELGYGPWSLVWWWMQNEEDPLRRLTVTNCWAERDLMRTLRQWRREAEAAGMNRIAELCDYLQADERMHVRLATDWIRRLADSDRQAELVSWDRDAVARIEGFYAGDDYEGRALRHSVRMAIRRIMPYHESPDFEATRAFYTRVLGLEEGNFGGGYIGFGSGQAQVVFAPPGVEPVLPDMGVDVDSRGAVDAAHAQAVQAGHEVIYGPVDEPWGVRRFFVRDPHGVVISVLAHE